MKVSIVIPVYNEENTIFTILNKINNIKQIDKEVIVIDDGSTDNTKNIIEQKCLNFIHKKKYLSKNYGKGYACREGIKISTGDIILIQDADLEYNPDNYPALIKPIISNQAKVVYGSRIMPGGKRSRPNHIMIKLSKLANFFLTKLSNLLNGQRLTDAHTCYKVFSKDVIKNIELVENGFNFCPEITAKVSKLGFKIYEVGIDYQGRSYKDGKKIKIIDGFSAIVALLKYNIKIF